MSSQNLSLNKNTRSPGNENVKKSFSSIGKKLFYVIVLANLIVAIFATAFLLRTDYQSEVDILNMTFDYIGKSSVQGLGQSLWNFDQEQLETLAKGILQVNDVAEVQVFNKEGKVIVKTANESADLEHILDREFPIVYVEDGETHHLGKLKVVATEANMIKRLKKKLIHTFFTQLVKTFMVAFLMLWIFKHFVSRHLEKMAHFLKILDIKSVENPPSLELKRKKRRTNEEDELDLLVNSITEMSNVIQQNNKKSLEYSQTLEKEVAERTHDIKIEKEKVSTLLNNIKQAIFAVDQNYKIVGPVSSYAKDIFHQDIEGESVWDTLYKDLSPTSEEYAAVRTSLISVMGEGDLQWDLSYDGLIKRLIYKNPLNTSDGRLFSISYNPLWSRDANQEKRLDKIIFIIEDITEIDKLTHEMEYQKRISERNIQLIQEMANNEVDEIGDFLNYSTVTLEESIKLCNEVKDNKVPMSEDVMQLIFRKLHTLKGNARLINFTNVSSVTHQAESVLAELREKMKEPGKFNSLEWMGKLINALYEITSVLELYTGLAKRVFKIKNNSSSKLIGNIKVMAFSLERGIEELNQGRKGNFSAKLLEAKRLAHSMKGTLKTLNWADVQTSIDLLEMGLHQWGEQGNSHHGDEGEKKWQMLVLHPFSEFKRTFKANLLKSDSFLPYNTNGNVWAPFLIKLYQLTSLCRNVEKSRRISTQESLLKQQIVENALSDASNYNFSYLSLVFGKLRDLANQLNDEFVQNIKSFRDALTNLGGYLQLAIHIDVQQNHPEKERGMLKFLLDEIENNPQLSSKKVEDSLEKFQGNSILIAVIKLISKENLHYSIFFETLINLLKKPSNPPHLDWKWSDYFVDNESKFPALEIVVGDFKKVSPAEFYPPVLSQLGKEKNELALSLIQFMEEGEKGESLIKHLDLIQFLSGHTDEAKKLGLNNDGTKYLPILPPSYQRLRDAISRAKEKRAVDEEVVSAFQKLMDISVNDSLSKLSQMVREISQSLNKKVFFDVKGQLVTMDRDSFGMIQDALIHLIRNSLDHGIETTEERMKEGKKPEGKLIIECMQDKEKTQIKIKDDGRGIDPESIKEKAILKKVITREKASRMSEQEILSLVFESNFSSRDRVTDLSGRGLGMTIVKNNIEKLGGNIQIVNKIGEGVEFILTCRSER